MATRRTPPAQTPQATATTSGATGGGISSVVSRFGMTLVEKATELAAMAAQFQPTGAMEGVGAVGSCGEMIRQCAATVEGLHRWSEDNPIEPAARDAIMGVVQALRQAADVADGAAQTMYMAHERDIQRIMNGRTNEHAWDVSANR